MRARTIHGAAILVVLAGGCDAVLGLEHRERFKPDGGNGTGTTNTSAGTGMSTSTSAGGSVSTSTSASTTGGSASSSGGAGGASNACLPGEKQCAGNLPQSCDGSGHWQDGVVCAAETPLCVAGVCIVPPSCVGLPSTCGPLGNESCCTSPSLPNGVYNRSNDPAYPAIVSDFRLDRFEITVGRFRKFLASYPGDQPQAGAGAHPLIADSGWQVEWNSSLALDQAALKMLVNCKSAAQTWTDAVGGNENKPLDCIDWYEAFAFCAWDGGRMPTEAEWNYAAAGGDEQRQYPWSIPPSSITIDSTLAIYGGTSIAAVGSKSGKGDGRWGQADLAGNVWEWTLDWFSAPYPGKVCDDCASISPGNTPDRVARGGSWYDSPPEQLTSGRNHYGPSSHGGNIGARCARAR